MARRTVLSRAAGVAAAALGLSLIVCTAVGQVGCARYPAATTGSTPALLFVTMQVEGRINPSYYYFVALQASPDSTTQGAHPEQGPFAVVQANPGTSSWGNGWGAGKITDYVVYNGAARQFSIDCSNLSTCPAQVAAGGVPIGFPFSYAVSGDRGQTLTVAIQLSTLGLNGAATGARALPGGVVVNVITTDHITTNPNDPPKPVDSLDVQGQLPLVDLHQPVVVTLNPSGPVLFPNSNVTIPDLHLTQVQLEVRLP